MSSSENQFESIRDSLVSQHADVSPGPMMSSPGIRYKGKVFAFYHDEAMTFKLGKGFKPEDYGISAWDWLSPFKNKPPMKSWFIVAPEFAEKWDELAGLALEQMKVG